MNAALLLTALFNGAWQGAVLCTLALFAFRMFRRLNATTMFTLWCVLLAIAVLLPAANYAFAPQAMVVTPHYMGAPVQTQQAPRLSLGAARVAPLPRPLRQAQDSLPHDDKATASAISPLHYAYVVDHDGTLHALTSISNLLRYAPWILLLVAGIAFVRLAILVRDVARMLLARKRVRTIAAPVAIGGEIAREFHYAASDEFTSPCVLGFAPPLIVIPEELLWEQSARLKSVVLHEREHVRRFDDVHNVLQRFIGAIAFFCPGVRIALREMALYREQICDDAAVNAIGDRLSYARTLTGLAQWAQGRGAPVPSLIFKRKHLVHRLEVLLDSAVSHSLRMNRRFALVAVTAVVVAALLVLRIQLPVIAETQSDQQQLHQQLTKVRADVKQLHVQAQKVREQVQTVRVQAKAIHTQVQAMHVQAKVVRANLAKVHADAAKVRAEVKNVRSEVRPIHVHLHAHAYARRAELAMAQAAMLAPAPPVTLAPPAIVASTSTDLLDALNSAGLRNLSIDDLISLRDHGVSATLVRSATSYFGHVSAKDLVDLADHGVGSNYLSTLTASGVRGISPDESIKLMDHGVSAPLISEAFGYFGHPSAEDLTYLADHGVTGVCLQAFRNAGLTGAGVRDIVRLVDNGVEGGYVAKVRHMMPRASIDDIIKLHNAGF